MHAGARYFQQVGPILFYIFDFSIMKCQKCTSKITKLNNESAFQNRSQQTKRAFKTNGSISKIESQGLFSEFIHSFRLNHGL